MPKTIFTGSHEVLVELLIDARKKAGLNQTELGQRLKRNQKFISLVESSQRRIDVLEFYTFCKAMGYDPVEMFASLVSKLPDDIEI